MAHVHGVFFLLQVLAWPCAIFTQTESFREFYSAERKTGYFATPGYPDDYPPNTRARWTFYGELPETDEIVKITFLHFDVHGTPPRCDSRFSDNVTFSDYANVEAGSRYYATLCGNTLNTPHVVTSKGTFFVVRFFSDEYDQAKGFRAKYEFINAGAGERIAEAGAGEPIAEPNTEEKSVEATVPRTEGKRVMPINGQAGMGGLPPPFQLGMRGFPFSQDTSQMQEAITLVRSYLKSAINRNKMQTKKLALEIRTLKRSSKKQNRKMPSQTTASPSDRPKNIPTTTAGPSQYGPYETMIKNITVFTRDRLEIHLSFSLEYFIGSPEYSAIQQNCDRQLSRITSTSALNSIKITAPEFTVNEFYERDPIVLNEIVKAVQNKLSGVCLNCYKTDDTMCYDCQVSNQCFPIDPRYDAKLTTSLRSLTLVDIKFPREVDARNQKAKELQAEAEAYARRMRESRG